MSVAPASERRLHPLPDGIDSELQCTESMLTDSPDDSEPPDRGVED